MLNYDTDLPNLHLEDPRLLVVRPENDGEVRLGIDKLIQLPLLAGNQSAQVTLLNL